MTYFVKLHRKHDGAEIWVNPAQVREIHPLEKRADKDGCILFFNDSMSAGIEIFTRVLEPMDQVAREFGREPGAVEYTLQDMILDALSKADEIEVDTLVKAVAAAAGCRGPQVRGAFFPLISTQQISISEDNKVKLKWK